jgi:hypothetical protein
MVFIIITFNNMINIMISGRRREGQALDLFYYEFDIYIAALINYYLFLVYYN